MSRLVSLFQRGFAKLTGGKRIAVLADEEFVLTGNDLSELLFSHGENRRLKGKIKELQEMNDGAYRNGNQRGLERSSERTLLLPSTVPNDKELVNLVSLIASELLDLDQADVKSCSWLFKKIYQCRSL